MCQLAVDLHLQQRVSSKTLFYIQLSSSYMQLFSTCNFYSAHKFLLHSYNVLLHTTSFYLQLPSTSNFLLAICNLLLYTTSFYLQLPSTCNFVSKLIGPMSYILHFLHFRAFLCLVRRLCFVLLWRRVHSCCKIPGETSTFYPTPILTSALQF